MSKATTSARSTLHRASAEGFIRLANLQLANTKERGAQSRLRAFLTQHILRSGQVVHLFSEAADRYTAEQLALIGSYMDKTASVQHPEIPEVAAVLRKETVIPPTAWLEGKIVYSVKFDLAKATSEQLRALVRACIRLAETLIGMGQGPECPILGKFPDYKYRGLPPDHHPPEQMWAVMGADFRTTRAGVLEWCLDQEDANAILVDMKKHSVRFPTLKVVPNKGMLSAGM